MMVTPDLTVVKDTGPLTEEYLPSHFVSRDGLIKKIMEHVSPAAVGWKPNHVWVHGPAGAGKSSCVREVLVRMEERQVKTAYVNCWSSQTFYSVLEAVFQELRALIAEVRDSSFKFDRLSRVAREHPLIIVLDEIDQMYLKERASAIYNLCRMNSTGLICISQSRNAFFALDNRVKSRLRPAFVEFLAYSAPDLSEILHDRAEKSLDLDSWCTQDLLDIAKRSAGDARIAIQTLRTAAGRAEKGLAGKIRPQDISEGIEVSSKVRKRYLLKTLSEHHRLLHQIVMETKKMKTTDLWKRYLQEARKRGLEPMARRTFTQYKLQMVTGGLLRERTGRGRRNTRVLEIVD